MAISKAEFIQKFFPLKGKKYSLDRYPMFTDIYNCPSSEILLKTGRQISKSTFNSRDILYDMMATDFFQSLFVCPLKDQTARFSNNYLGTDMENIPLIRDNYLDATVSKNVFSRGLNNGSLCQLTYAMDDADRARGIPSDKLTYDEVQDIPIANIPIINECLSASPYKLKRYTGTPKTMDNTIEQLWRDSLQCEWIITCMHCSAENIPNELHAYKMLREGGPACYSCSKTLDVRKGRWVAFGSKTADVFGFHIPQIIMPMHTDTTIKDGKSPWKDILRKYRTYSEAQFANEVLGLSYDFGGRLVSLSELEAACTNRSFTAYDPFTMEGRIITAGVDWGVSSVSSYTVLVIGSIDPIRHDYIVHFIKKFSGTDILLQIKEICELCKLFNVAFIAPDVGVGNVNNALLQQEFGRHRVFPMQYTTANFVMEFRTSRGFFSLDKTAALNIMFFAIKQRRILFPEIDYMLHYFPDFLSIFEEIVETPKGVRKIFNHNKNIPDDTAHALTFALCAAYKAISHHILQASTGEDLPTV